MRNPTVRAAALAAALLALPAAAHAQVQAQPTSTQTAAAPAQNEAAQLQQRIAALQQQAMQDPALKAAEDNVGTVLQAAMERLDPAAHQKSARAEAMKAEIVAARAANDVARLNQLARESDELTAYFNALRPRAMAQPEVQAARQAYIEKMFERMKQIDPNVQQYVDRLAELRQSTRAQTGGGR
ncbi:MAG TPA: hypothetical protein VFS20_14675 [Longimicrobium sp.]|nr:hypothetical protein [Longimicrobium sp.]